ncbi:hypothetical protein D3C75_1363440 [compost metagenome]
MIIRPRRRSGIYSDTSVTQLGITAPKPRPVRKRSKAISSGVRAKVLSRLNNAKHRMDSSSTFLRPKRSE